MSDKEGLEKMNNKINQKRLKISKLRKKYVITVIMILILANVGLALNEMMKEETMEKTQVVSSFTNTPGISYKVYLKENSLFNDRIQPQDIGYFSALTDHIEVTFDNKYRGISGAEYKGDYSLLGEITGWEVGTENPSPAWTKQFVVSSKKNFQTTEDELTLSSNANLDFNHFNTFVAQVGEQTGYNTRYTIKVTMMINYSLKTAEGVVEESLQPYITIPLGEKYFKITKSGNDEIKKDITKTIEVPAPVNLVKMSLFITVIILCLMLLILFLSAVEPTLTDIQRKQVKQIMKVHGKRLVALEKKLKDEDLAVCSVHSIDDMVKLSDEIERPIFYVFQNDFADIKEFFIIDQEKVYLYKVPEGQIAEKKKKDSKKAEAPAESGDRSTITV